jgi:hypothetical protein
MPPQLTQDGHDLQAREPRADAVVDAVAEADMLTGVAAIGVEGVGLIELAWVTVGGVEQQHDPGPGGDHHPVDGDLAGRDPSQPVGRTPAAQRLLDGPLHQVRLGPQPLLQGSVARQVPEGTADRVHRVVVPGHAVGHDDRVQRVVGDRLTVDLGLGKGQMSEAELHFIKARLRGGQLSKARRGELIMPLPVGLVYDAAGHVILDPDAAVHGALAHLFTTFEATGSATACVKAFHAAGAAHPGYITLEQYDANLARLKANAATHGADRRSGPPREGAALLQGIIICGRCGTRMTVRYHQRGGVDLSTYLCQRDGIENAERIRTTLPGHTLDQRIGQLLIDTLTPLAVEAALQVSAELEQRPGHPSPGTQTHRQAAAHLCHRHPHQRAWAPGTTSKRRCSRASSLGV